MWKKTDQGRFVCPEKDFRLKDVQSHRRDRLDHKMHGHVKENTDFLLSIPFFFLFLCLL